MERSDVAIIIPAFNEAATIGPVIRGARELGTVIVADDSSTDGTAEVVEREGGVVVRRTGERGYDRALNSGFVKAHELGCRFAVTIDADGQHDPRLIRDFLKALETSDLVLGIRPRTQRWAEKVFAYSAYLRFGVRDPLCGMKGYRMELFRELGHFDSYESIGTELALFGLRRGARFVQIPVPVRDRQDQPRFGRAWRANYRIVRAMLKGLAQPRMRL